MISIDTYPPLVTLAKNPVVFQLSSDNKFSTEGIRATCRIDFTDALPVDDSFDLVWGDNIITITAKASPDDSGNQIKAGPVVTTLAVWVALTKSYLDANYFLNRDFLITVALTSITFTALDTGTAYGLDIDNEDPTKMSAAVTAGVDEVARDFFSLLLQVYVNSTKWFEGLLSVDVDGIALTDISEILKAYVFSEFQFPETDANAVILRTNILKAFHIKFAEQYGNPLIPNKLTASPTYYALDGGVSFWKQSEYYQDGTSFWSKLLLNMQFLTWQPNNKLIDVDQVEKLYFLAWKIQLISETCKVYVNCYYKDANGEYQTTTIITPLVQVMNYMEVFELQVSYDRINALLDLDQYFYAFSADGAPGQYYEVSICTNAYLTISEMRRYYLDFTEYQNKRYFLFKNSLGGYDTLRTTGDDETDNEISRSFITRPYPKAFDAAFLQKKQTFIDGYQKGKVNTGWLTIEQITWLQDFLLSDEVYEIVGSKIYPCNIVSTSGPKYTNQQTPGYFLEFEYERAGFDASYASGIEPVGGDFNNDFNNDFKIQTG